MSFVSDIDSTVEFDFCGFCNVLYYIRSNYRTCFNKPTLSSSLSCNKLQYMGIQVCQKYIENVYISAL